MPKGMIINEVALEKMVQEPLKYDYKEDILKFLWIKLTKKIKIITWFISNM